MDTTDADLSDAALKGLSSAQNPVDIYQTVLTEIDECLEADGCAVALKISGELTIMETAGELYEDEYCWTTLSSHSQLYEVYQTGEPCLRNDVPEVWGASDPVQFPDPFTYVRSYVSVPLANFGIIFAVATAPRGFSDADRAWLLDLAEYAATAFDFQN